MIFIENTQYRLVSPDFFSSLFVLPLSIRKKKKIVYCWCEHPKLGKKVIMPNHHSYQKYHEIIQVTKLLCMTLAQVRWGSKKSGVFPSKSTTQSNNAGFYLLHKTLTIKQEFRISPNLSCSLPGKCFKNFMKCYIHLDTSSVF